MLRGLAVLAHELDGKGYGAAQRDSWQSSLAAYMTATILPPVSSLRTVTIDVSGFLHSESRQLLLDVISRLHAQSNIAFRFQLEGKREEEVLFGRQTIDRTVLEQSLSERCGYRVVIPKYDLLLPRSLLVP